MTEMSEDRHLTEEDRDKIVRLLESGALENVKLALSLIEETATEEDLQALFTEETILAGCLDSLEAIVLTGNIIKKSQSTWNLFIEVGDRRGLYSPVKHMKGDITDITPGGAKLLVTEAWGSIDYLLNSLTSLSGAAATNLSTYSGSLELNGLMSLSNAAADGLSGHEGALYLNGLTKLSDALAEFFSKHKGDLYLNGLTTLSDASATSLSKHEGELNLDGLISLSDAAAKSFSKHQGQLSLNGLAELSCNIAESLSKHNGALYLDGVSGITDATISALCQCVGPVQLGGLEAVSDTGAIELSKSSIVVSNVVINKTQSLIKKQAKATSTLNKIQQANIRKLLKSKEADNVKLACDLLIDTTASAGDWAALFPVTRIRQLLVTWDPKIWFILALRMSPFPYVFQLLKEQARDRLNSTAYGMSSKISWLIDALISDPDSNDAAIDLLNYSRTEINTKVSVLSDLQASRLLRYTGDMRLDGIRIFSDSSAHIALVDKLCKQKGDLSLDSFTALTDTSSHIALAKKLSLSKYSGSLNNLTNLSDAATEILSKHQESLGLNSLTSLSDAAAESLSKHNGDLSLDGLTSLSDAAAESLSKHNGKNLSLDGLTSLSDAAAKSLSNHNGDLSLDGLTSLKDAAAESLRKHQGQLGLDGLTSLSDAAAESLAKKEQIIYRSFIRLGNLPESAAKILRDAGHGFE